MLCQFYSLIRNGTNFNLFLKKGFIWLKNAISFKQKFLNKNISEFIYLVSLFLLNLHRIMLLVGTLFNSFLT